MKCSFEDIKKLIIESANVDKEILPNSILKTDLGIDSIYAVEMILALEEKFGIQIELDEMDTMMMVSQVVDVVNRKLGEK
ncbi:MAG: acyl carrier protein [Acholeplasmatales bacterium]|nr:acyl carrier protein [Acholeplasmatales bacterium]